MVDETKLGELVQLHVNGFPQQFIDAVVKWGEQQMPPLNKRQTVMKVFDDWIQANISQQRESRDDAEARRQAEIAEMERKLAEMKRQA